MVSRSCWSVRRGYGTFRCPIKHAPNNAPAFEQHHTKGGHHRFIPPRIGDVALTVEIAEKITLPANARQELARHKTARRRAEEQAQEAMKTTKKAARALTKAGLSVRDSDSLLGLTGARVSRILNDTSKQRSG